MVPKLTLRHIYIYIYAARPGSGPLVAILMVRFWPTLMVRFWPKMIVTCFYGGFRLLLIHLRAICDLPNFRERFLSPDSFVFAFEGVCLMIDVYFREFLLYDLPTIHFCIFFF